MRVPIRALVPRMAGALVAALLIGSCSPPEVIADGIDAPDRLLVQVDVTPDTVSLAPGGTAEFTTSYFFDDGTALHRQAANYRSTGGSINSSGNFTAGGSIGAFLVFGAAGGLEDTSLVVVLPSPTEVVGVRLDPPSAALLPGATQEFSALAVLRNGGTAPIDVDFTATGGSISGNGLYTAGQQVGSFFAVAAAKGGAPADTAEIVITQPVPTLTAVVLTPPTVAIDQGAVQQFTAMGALSDGSQVQIPVTWTATGGAINSSGRYTAGSNSGSFRAIARAVDGKADTSNITIRTPSITGITTTPSQVALQTGQAQQFSATAQLSNGGTQQNPSVTWSATGGTITQGGLYTGGTVPGTYAVTATANGRADTSIVTLSLANVVGLVLSPNSSTVVEGGSRDFTVQGLLSNGGTLPTPQVNWTATGGSISTSGRYTAGTTPGSYRAIATLVGGSVADTAEISVVEQGSDLYPNRPPSFTNVVSDVDLSWTPPAGGGNERVVPGSNNQWSVIYDANGSGGSNWSRIDDPTAPQSPSSVWQLRFPAGTWSDGHGSGNLGRALPNVNDIYISYWVKWDPQFEFHPISSKHIRLQKNNGNFLIQATHSSNFLRASDEGIGVGYEPQIGSKPAMGVWHHVEAVVRAGTPGTVQIWLNGQLRTNYTNLRVSGPFNAFSIDGHLGGGGMTKVRESFYWIDHIFIATP